VTRVATTHVAVHVAPHPDDEILGCGGTLVSLRRAGWTVINLACSLGTASDAARRDHELQDSLAHLGFEDRRLPAGGSIARAVVDLVAQTGASLVVSPHAGDGHPRHEAVGQSVASCGPDLGAAGAAWWSWGLWQDLPQPTIYAPYSGEVMDRLLGSLAAHRGELERNPYHDLLPARARALAILGSERVFGYGSGYAGGPFPYADLLCESRWDGAWVPQAARVLDAGHPFGVPGRDKP
jgi:LmbE family N-acetylglucosaminyl deacetylase